MRLVYSMLFLLALPLIPFVRNVQNVWAELEGNNVVILYNRTGQPGQTYKVELLPSHNSYAFPLRLLSGDIGDNMTPGLPDTPDPPEDDRISNIQQGISMLEVNLELLNTKH